jgi:hypothetical protein
MTPKPTLHDRGPAAAPTTQTVTGAEQHAFVTAQHIELTPAQNAAVARLNEAAIAVENHIGPRAGPEYDAKVRAWRERHAEWRLAMRTEVKA